MGPMEVFLWEEVVVQGKFFSSSLFSRNDDLD